jgi:FmdE, Molybdenum formylmethanofuran dehydrogenase operon
MAKSALRPRRSRPAAQFRMTNQRGNAQRPKGIRTPDRSVDRGGRTLTPTALRQAAVFHGHLGPWLVLGLKAGTYARRKLAASPFELDARVFCPAGTPHTCFVDGVQFSSGCTMGKGNISHHRANGCRVEFTRTGDGVGLSGPRRTSHHKDPKRQRGSDAKLCLALRREVWDELHSRPSRGMAGAARLGREFARRPLKELFAE